jgi:branched-chain amino acid transport system substrate-binding protein
MTMTKLASAALLTVLLASTPARSQETYVIGISAALTGPAASTLAGAVAGLRLYVDQLNQSGGVNGHRITLDILDDQAAPSKAAVNAKKLLIGDKVSLLINMSLSSTYTPMIAETKRAQVPMLFVGAVCPTDVYPPANDYLFCSTSYSAKHDGYAAVEFMKQRSGANIKVGLATMAIPVARMGADATEQYLAADKIKMIGKEIIPPATADYTPFATKLMQGKPDWVYSWSPWVTEIKTFDALRKLGWKGQYALQQQPETENEMTKIKDDKLIALGSNAMFFEGLPIQKKIEAAAKAAKSTYSADQMTDGWIGGMVIETALKSAGWPASPAKIRDAMANLKIDTEGLRGGPLVWTKENHFRTKQYYRAYRWNPAKNGLEIVMDWKEYDIK